MTAATAQQSLTPALVITGLRRAYGARTVIDGLNLRIARGEFIALLGESGCGKTTLLRAVAGLDAVDGGVIEGPRRPAVVFQEHRLLPWDTLWKNVALGLPGHDVRTRAAAALAEVGLGDRLDDWPRNLSGGQAQRVALARALVQEPQLLLLDEPFAALDALTRIRMHDLVRELVARHRPGVLLVTHDVDEAIALADRILVMRDGRLAAEHRPAPGQADATRARLLAELGVGVRQLAV
ncbi:ABC transporter ATP-binding protein [Bradyrhizobium sp. U87765 SZCCT0131]|uniref:ABC transporter ATP-binding protein n=1 Tax=unclassified Bradyrhizobium TaxID=2631580 RepID=UPI001BA9438E|nr:MULTISPECIES: ABC transporter ATP-binding protein [unclassified Bradyrhizobium]MBR1217743.1 ABC transporter ATP-binding protein [Bradyrhizobium sp. U87765 SZCCT0131]MBR1261311.1 ABC transporter ATP-binding protein [Bradyrhizobium sp. U87765 SZCCT0134]MBR1303241.1 ABC transporter ATP-binding protein [Bradyrhizobium sp. U87765 SZCCT0110]MBR1318847.1 ABC transporter ATP-binding protein [Bradyrhizobium sp. U87765 SZCCT0109]MBR1347172.1 ABC transporter ATP-binding protein [Bradyrhizobium sp. U87